MVFTQATPTPFISKQRTGTISEKRKAELNKFAEKQRSNTKDEMNYLMKHLDALTPGSGLLLDLKYSLGSKDIQIEALERTLKYNSIPWLGKSVWVDRIFTSGFSVLATLCLLKGTGLLQSSQKGV